VYVGRVQGDLSNRPRLLTLTNVTADQEALAIPASLQLFLEVLGQDAWQPGAPAIAEAEKRERAREALFDVELHAYGASSADKLFEVVILIENLYLTRLQRVPGVKIGPLENTGLGFDVVETLNAVLGQLGYRKSIDPGVWMQQMQQRRPAAVMLLPKVRASDVRSAADHARESAQRLLDLLSLKRGTAPRVLGGWAQSCVAKPEVGDPEESIFWIEGPGYKGNLMGGDISGEEQHSLLAQWNSMAKDRRTELWLSLYRSAMADERWDYNLFRYFNLMEAIASEAIPPKRNIVDPTTGAVRLQVNRKPYTTDHARGKVYELLRMVASVTQTSELSFVSTKSDGSHVDLWGEIGVWVDVRNAVAHTGSWESPPGSTPTAKQIATEEEIKLRGHDGTVRSGIGALVLTERQGIEAALYAYLHGLM
jgi:hypothetical protein